MKLIFIYGPMSVGKFTTAKELARLTGYRLFHNHLTVDTVRAVFPDHEPPYSSLIRKIRFMMLEAAAKAGYNTIFTFGYSGEVDDDQVNDIVEAVERYGGEVDFVQLYAPIEELLKHRIEGKTRQTMEKVYDPARLKKTLAERDMYAAVKHPNNLRIDNTNLPASQTAQKIIEHYKLSTL